MVLIAGHNLLDRIQSSNPVWSVLHSLNFIVTNPRYSVFVAYTLIPWVGVTAVGYGLGQIYAWTSERRRAFLLRAGLRSYRRILVLRGINIYGDGGYLLVFRNESTVKAADFCVLQRTGSP